MVCISREDFQTVRLQEVVTISFAWQEVAKSVVYWNGINISQSRDYTSEEVCAIPRVGYWEFLKSAHCFQGVGEILQYN